MALIIYPLPNANTFADIAIADSTMGEFFPEKATEWNALDQAAKEAALLQSFMFMTTCNGLKIPPDYGESGSVASSDFILAQVFLCGSRIGKSLFDIDDNDRAVTKEKVGDLEVEYDVKHKTSSHEAPALFYQLMSKYGCGGGTGFSQSGVK